jgi:GAF domain-containing protein/DNA-binding CsgD family transcriptional regulator
MDESETIGQINEIAESAPAAPYSRYDILVRISKAISECSSAEELLGIVADELSKVLQFLKLYVLIFTQEENIADIQWYDLGSGDIPWGHIPVKETQSWWVHVNQRPLLISDWEEETRFPRLKQFMDAVGIRSSCVVPLATKHHRLGALTLGGACRNAYSDEDVHFLYLVANHVALALDDGLNFEASQRAQAELQREKDRLKILLELTNRLVSQLDLRELLRSICNSIRPVIKCDSATLILPEQGDKRLRVFVHEFPRGKGIIREGTLVREYLPNEVFRTGQRWSGSFRDLYTIDLRNDYPAAESLKTFCVLPLICRGQNLGILSLGRLQESEFSEDEINFFMQIANQVAIAIDNALNFEELRRAQTELQREEVFLAEGQRLGHTGSWRWLHASKALLWSQEHFRMCGFDPRNTKLSIRVLWRRINPKDRIPLRTVVSKAISEKRNFETNFGIILPDKSRRCIYTVGHAIVDGSGRLIEFVGTSIDVTDRKRTEDERADLAPFEARFYSLSRRQQQVMKYVAAGMLNKQIAAELAISEIMVKVHRRKMMQKMHVGSLAELARITDRIFRAVTRG